MSMYDGGITCIQISGKHVNNDYMVNAKYTTKTVLINGQNNDMIQNLLRHLLDNSFQVFCLTNLIRNN